MKFAGGSSPWGDADGIRPGSMVAANVGNFCGECYFCKARLRQQLCVRRLGAGLPYRRLPDRGKHVRVPSPTTADPHPDSLDYEDVIMISCILPSGYFGTGWRRSSPAVRSSWGPACGLHHDARLFRARASYIVAVDVVNEKRLEFAKRTAGAT